MGKVSRSSSERRKDPRVRLSFPVKCSFKDPARKDGVLIESQGQALDVSNAGLCLQFDNPVALLHGASMDLILDLLSGSQPIRAEGWVRWSAAGDNSKVTRAGALIAVTKGKTILQQAISGRRTMRRSR